MRNVATTIAMLTLMTSMTACDSAKMAARFGDDLAFLQKHTDVVVLSDQAGQAQVAIVPAYQARVMTSTAQGAKGLSFGWINRELIASGKILPHINSWGGEDRFWLGPEGGQFAIFFKKGDPFDLEHWQTPAIIDTDAFDVVSTSKDRASFRRTARLTNYSGATFDVRIDRTVRLLGREQASQALGQPIPASLRAVVYESDNTLTNAGKQVWKKETGLLSIWILGIFNPSPKTTVVIPFHAGPDSQLGPKVNDAYFGKVPPERLVVKDDVLYFRGDGQYRSKIGLGPKRAKPILGSYDAVNKVLTLVQYTKPKGATDYVNSMWELQKQPYGGDVVNSYNDGPATPGAKPFGPFYELETSSPAAVLKPNASISHVHRTFHIQGDEKDLDALARATLGVGLAEIERAFSD